MLENALKALHVPMHLEKAVQHYDGLQLTVQAVEIALYQNCFLIVHIYIICRTSALKSVSCAIMQGTAVVGGLYVWKQFTQPLLIQPIMSVMQLIESPLAQIYFFRKAPAGSNARPFKEDNPLAA